jgi:NADH:ubiquinone oxidoreductase subunit H
MLIGDYTFLTVIALLFITNTVIQYRLGFKMGSVGGYSVGVYDAIKYLLKDEMIVSEDGNTTFNAVDLSNYIISHAQLEFNDNKDLSRLKMPGEKL